MHCALRIGFVIVGLSALLVGAACVTGGWLGVPSREEVFVFPPEEPVASTEGAGGRITTQVIYRDGGMLSIALLIVGGIVLLAIGAWPRRRPVS